MDSIGLTYLITIIVSYFVGSIPFGILITKITGAGNLREIGSGNIGATNVLRTGRKGIALATLILDIGKGAVTVIGAQHYGLDNSILAGLFTIIGHTFPIWLKFRGGKGVATSIGAFLALSWQVGLLVILTWLAVAALFRYSSLSAIIALLLSPFFAWIFANNNITIMVAIAAVLSIFRHRDNIGRLTRGEETRITIGKKE